MPSKILASTLDKFSTFGDLLRFLRRRVGITQMELAIAVGYSDAQISRLEQNLRMPDIPTIQARFVPALYLDDEPKVVERLLDLASNVSRADAPAPGLCPYKGLSYFDEEDADLFVGRETLTNRLVARILSLDQPSGRRFLAVVGASGSGKSSLVRAGLVPSLRWNKTSSDWDIHIITPTAHPLESLALNLVEENGSVAVAARLMDDLAGDVRSLHLLARREMKRTNQARLLLIVDQFEEVFTLCRSEEERAAFIGNLLTAASESDGPAMVVITLRADFYAHCANYLALREALADQQEYIGAMSDKELHFAIEEPARRGRWELEPGLTELFLHDVGHEPGALPLLSHALLETWQRRRGRMLTLSGYISSGGVRGAIAETAEAVFTDQFNQEQKAIARRIFLRLTELGDETATGDTRRRAAFKELISNDEEALTTQNVLRVLADARLIITREDSAEVAHEALIREWPTLRSWLEDNREGLRLHRRLTEAAQEWVAHNRDVGVLYRGVRLSQAHEWALSHQEDMNALELEFLEASQALVDCEASEREEQRLRELEAARKLAETEGRRAEEQTQAARQLRRRSVFLMGTLVVVLVLAVTAGILEWQAQTASLLASSRELAASSTSNLAIDPERSILLALEAVAKAHTTEAEEALHQAVLASRLRRVISAYGPGTMVSVVFSPDGLHFATASQSESVKIWDSATGEVIYTTNGHFATFSPDGKQMAIITADGMVTFLNAITLKPVSISGQIDAGAEVAFSPDGSRLAAVTTGSLPRVWDVNSGKELVNFPGHTDFVSFVYFSPDGDHLLTTSDDGSARVWDAASGKELLNLSDHTGLVWNAAYSPDGSRIAVVSGNEATIWDAANGNKLLTLTGHMSTIYAVAFSPDGSRLATGGLDRLVKIWDAKTGKELFTLAGHTGAISSVAFTHDGTRLVSASDDGTLRIWDLTPSREWLTIEAPKGSSQIAFSPDGKQLAGGGDQAVKVWDASNGQELHNLTGYKDWVSTLAFSPDGKRLIAAGEGSDVKVWDMISGEEFGHWPAHTGRVNSLAFSPDGNLLATASNDYKIKLWNVSNTVDSGVTTIDPSFTFDLPAEVKALAFSPDGTRMAAGTQKGIIKAWDLASRTELFTIWGHTDDVVSVAFSPDGKLLASSSLDGTARLWNSTTGQENLTLHGHTGPVTAVVFSPDGSQVATASRDGTTKLWQASTGQEILTLFGDGAGLNSLVFSPDGTRLATSGDHGIRVYLLRIEDLIALARSRVTRRLTSEECQKYLHHITAACEQPAVIPTATPWPSDAASRICQVTNTGGLYDHYFNELIFKGLQDSARLYGWKANVLQSASVTDYEKNIKDFVNSKCALIVVPGNLVETVGLAAETNANQKFMVMDWALDPPLDNVWIQIYAIDQSAFLAGYVAAYTTKTGKVGLFGGVDIPQVTEFMDGFALGVQYYNKKNGTSVEVIGWDPQKHAGLFVGGFCCAAEGRQITKELLDQGVDIILPVAGQSIGWGAGAEIEEHGNAWLIGVDTDWTQTYPEFTNILLTSIEKRFDVSVTQAAGSIVGGRFTGGIHVGNLDTGEVGLSPFHDLDGLISPQVKTDLEQIKADIIAEKIDTRP